jgi:multiple sugar transport system substrate-binding protein
VRIVQGLSPVFLGAAIAMAPLGAHAADLVVWWEKGLYAQEDEAVAETIAAFEQESGKQVELTYFPITELPDRIEAALKAGPPPDFAFGTLVYLHVAQWAFDDRLVSLSDAIGHFADLFDADALARATLFNAKTGQKALYGLPIGRSSDHIFVWKSLLERAGFTLADIPKQWDPFWAFWCDQVQPAVRKALGREDIWAVGLAMSAKASDTDVHFSQFRVVYDADYVTRDGRLVIDDPQFHNQAVVMTLNDALSIPKALRHDRPDDYYNNVATLEWPLGSGGEHFPIVGYVFPAVVFKEGKNVATATAFVRFLVSEGWLAHYLDFSGERFIPPMQKLLDQPFWLDPSDPHQMAAVMQISSRPLAHNYAATSGNWRHDLVEQQNVWGQAIHRVAAEGISPEQAVDEAIARIKQILAE